MEPARTFMRIAEGRSLATSWRQPMNFQWSCTTSTSPSRLWRICFYTTREGACANELESFCSAIRSRCARCAAQFDRDSGANHVAAADVRVHLRTGNDTQRHDDV